jgi:hypothetical protein
LIDPGCDLHIVKCPRQWIRLYLELRVIKNLIK